MHATRARLPQKRTRTKKPAAKKATAEQASALKPSAAPATAVAGPSVVILATHRAARRPAAVPACEIYALVEWIAPARESWRRGELEVRRTACMPLTATATADGTLNLTELPGQGDPIRLDASSLAALQDGRLPALELALPGLRVTLTAADLAPALPAPRPTAQVLAFRARR
jgi:hypothetical protein